MFRKFAASMSPAIDWCSYWEIDRYDRPCPVDYTAKRISGINLPANFDVATRCSVWRCGAATVRIGKTTRFAAFRRTRWKNT
jgi:hypothetical protein